MTLRKLEVLEKLSALIFEAEQTKLTNITACCNLTKSKIDDLDTAVRRQNDVIASELEAPIAGHVLDRWGAWAEIQRINLNTELAQQNVVLEEQRQKTLVAFGRSEALKTLQEKNRVQTRMKARRRFQ